MYPVNDNLLYSCIFILFTALCWYIWNIIKKYKVFPSPLWSLRGILKILSGNYPGSLLFGNRAFSLVVALSKDFEKEGLFFIWGFQPIIFVYKDEYVKILVNNHSATDKPLHYEPMADIVGKGIFLHSGSIWHERAKHYRPAFRSDALRNKVSTFNCVARSLVNELLQASLNPKTDVYNIIKKHFLKSLFESLFQIPVKSEQEEKRFLEFLKVSSRLNAHIEYAFNNPWLLWKPLARLYYKRHPEVQKDSEEFHNYVKNVVEELVKSRDSFENGEHGNKSCKKQSLPRILIDKHFKDPSFTLQDVVNDMKHFTFAGHETVSLTMLWCLFMLGHHPEAQERAFEEVESITGGNDVDISYSDISNLNYTEAVIKETLRLFPIAPIYGRSTIADIECGKYKIPKNTALYFNIYSLHRNAEFFPDPEKFIPERFFEKSLKNPWTYIPFAEGLRSCTGKNFGMTELKVFLAHVIRSVKVTSLDSQESLVIVKRLTLMPMKPLRFKITSR